MTIEAYEIIVGYTPNEKPMITFWKAKHPVVWLLVSNIFYWLKYHQITIHQLEERQNWMVLMLTKSPASRFRLRRLISSRTYSTKDLARRDAKVDKCLLASTSTLTIRSSESRSSKTLTVSLIKNIIWPHHQLDTKWVNSHTPPSRFVG